MKALTIQQPWAWWIFRGHSLLWERFPGKPRVRGYFLVHAGMGWDFDAELWMAEKLDLEVPADLPRAQILGYARLTNVTLAEDRFPRNGFAFHLSDVHEFRTQRAVAAGRRGFWVVPQRILSALTIPYHVQRNPL